MLRGLKESPVSSEVRFLYILECCDGTYYTGITNDLERRFRQHNDGRGARYTRTRRPVKLLYTENCEGRSKALIRECAVKSLPRDKKRKLIELPSPTRG